MPLGKEAVLTQSRSQWSKPTCVARARPDSPAMAESPGSTIRLARRAHTRATTHLPIAWNLKRETWLQRRSA